MSDRWQREMRTVVGRDFSSATVSDGLYARILSFMKRPNADGQSSYFTADFGTNNFTCTAHGHQTGNSVKLLTTGVLPTITGGSLLPNTEYYFVKIDDNTFKLSTTWYNSKNAIYIYLTGNGTGSHSVQKMGGGANWYLKGDFTPAVCKAVSYLATAVNTTTENINIPAHPFYNGQSVTPTLTAGGLVSGTIYFVYRVDDDNIKLSQYGQGENGSPNSDYNVFHNLSSQAANTLTPMDYQVIFCDTENPQPNDYNTSPTGGAPKWVRIGYTDSVSPSNILKGIVAFLSYDSSRRVMKGHYGGSYPTFTSGEFIYYLGGGDAGLIVSTKPAGTWSSTLFTEIEPIPYIQESVSVVGTVKTDFTNGTNKIIELNLGQAALFTVGYYYFVYDLRTNFGTMSMFKITARDTSLDTITVDSVSESFSSGSVVCAYAHRFIPICDGANNATPVIPNSGNTCAPPYVPNYSNYTACSILSKVDNNNAGMLQNYAYSPAVYLDELIGFGRSPDAISTLFQKILFTYQNDITYNNTMTLTRGTPIGKAKLYVYGGTTASISAFQHYKTADDGKEYITLTDLTAGNQGRFFRHSISYV